MPKTPMPMRTRMSRREHGLQMRDFIDLFFGVEDIKAYLLEQLKADEEEKKKLEKEAKEKGAKEAKENYFKAKFTFTHMFLAVLTAGPICGIFGYIFLRAIFG